MTKIEIKNLIVTGELKKALIALTELLPSHQNTLILLQSRLNGLAKKEISGIVSSSNANIEKNRITAAALSLLGDLPDDKVIDEGVVDKPDAVVAPAKKVVNKNVVINKLDKKELNPAKSILFVAANPSSETRLQTDVELRTIKDEMIKGAKRGDFEFLPVEAAVRITDLIRALQDKPTIIHFAGHGEEEGIIISTNENDGLTLNDATMEMLFKPLAGNTELLILNNCYSAKQAKIISAHGIIVVGYNIPIGDAAATSFSKGFYVGLSEGMSYQEAYFSGKIVLSAEHSASVKALEVWKDGEMLAW